MLNCSCHPEDPNFDQAAETGIAWSGVNDGFIQEPDGFAANVAEHVAALLGNLVAEERKAAGAPLPFQYTNYEVVADLLGGLRDGHASHDEQSKLFDQVLDPKPVVRKEPPREDRRDDYGDDRDRDRYERRDDRDDYDRRDTTARSPGRGRPPPPPPPGSGSGGMHSERTPMPRSHRTGMNLCRQWQSGRCSYGDDCRFAHEKQ